MPVLRPLPTLASTVLLTAACRRDPAPPIAEPCDTLLDQNGECVMPEDSTGTTTGTNSGANSTSSSDTDSTGPVPCGGPEDCPDPAAPFCNDASVCVPCSLAPDPAQADAACAFIDPLSPLCRDDGRCVTCTALRPELCDVDALVCDDPAGECVPCSAHEHCQPAACNLFTGLCLPKDEVVHVGPGQDYPTLFAAVSTFTAVGDQGTIIVHPASYNETITVASERVLAFLAADIGGAAIPPEWDTSAGNPNVPQLSVTTGATVLLDGLQLSGNGSSMAPGLRLDDANAWLDRTRVVDNNGGGIRAQNGSELVLRNCFVGGDISDQDAVIVDGSAARLFGSTLAAGFGNANALRCTGDVTVDARSSLIVARTDAAEIQCMGATLEHNAAELDLGGTNTPLGNMSTAWFLDYGAGDFHLSASRPATIDTAAQWQEGDAPTDIDGDPRPAVAGPDFAGADVPL